MSTNLELYPQAPKTFFPSFSFLTLHSPHFLCDISKP